MTYTSAYCQQNIALWQALESARPAAAVRAALAQGANPNARSAHDPHLVPLAYCVQHTLFGAAQALVEAGAVPWVEGVLLTHQPLYRAVLNEAPTMFDQIAKGYQVPSDIQKVLVMGVFKSHSFHPDWMERLLPLSSPQPWSWLDYADMVRWLGRSGEGEESTLQRQALNARASLRLLEEAGVFSALDPAEPVGLLEGTFWTMAGKEFDSQSVLSHRLVRPFVERTFPIERARCGRSNAGFSAWLSRLELEGLEKQVAPACALAKPGRL